MMSEGRRSRMGPLRGEDEETVGHANRANYITKKPKSKLLSLGTGENEDLFFFSLSVLIISVPSLTAYDAMLGCRQAVEHTFRSLHRSPETRRSHAAQRHQ